MGRKRRRSPASAATTAQHAGVRPEQSGPAAELYGADHERYHGQNAGLQRDMAELAVALLGLQVQSAGGAANPPASAFLADLGCGSGLSAAALSRQAGVGGWAGTDITPEMAQLAARQPGAAGRLVVQDFGQGLPFRPESLDGAISVSAVQWLCTAANPAASILRFFDGLAISLRPGARAALQIYAEDDGQAQQLLAGARAARLDAGFFVSLPHTTAAKKFYLLCERPAAVTGQQQQPQQAQQPLQQRGECLSACPCNLAWPKTGSCLLAWLHRLQQEQGGQDAQQGQQQSAQPEAAQHQQLPQTAGAATQLPSAAAEAARRLQREHAATGRRMVRLLRRAEALSSAQPESAGGASGDNSGSQAAAAAAGVGNPSSSTASLVVQAEVEAWGQLGLMPCGSPIFVQLTAAAELLEGGSPGNEAVAAQQAGAKAAAAAADCSADADAARFAPALQAAARALLAAGSTAGDAAGQVRCTLVKPAGQEEAERYFAIMAQLGIRLFAAPPAAAVEAGADGGGTTGGKGGRAASTAHRFMRLEPLEAVQGQQPGPAAEGQQHQAQQAQQDSREPALAAAVLHAHKTSQHLVLRCSLACGPAECGLCSGGSSGPGSSISQRGLACAGCMAGRLADLCRELSGCVIGLDARLLGGRADATWLVWLAGLQQLDRAELAAALLRHFPAAS